MHIPPVTTPLQTGSLARSATPSGRFDFYGFRVEVTGDAAELIDEVGRDFAYFRIPVAADSAWSSPPDAGDASITCSNANYALEPPMGCEGGSLRVAPAGSRSPSGDGRWGHADLAGNLAEWTFDQFDAPLPDTCADCASFSGAAPADTVRAAHGGAFSSRREFVYAASAAPQKPSTRSGATGLRCARVP